MTRQQQEAGTTALETAPPRGSPKKEPAATTTKSSKASPERPSSQRTLFTARKAKDRKQSSNMASLASVDTTSDKPTGKTPSLQPPIGRPKSSFHSDITADSTAPQDYETEERDYTISLKTPPTPSSSSLSSSQQLGQNNTNSNEAPASSRTLSSQKSVRFSDPTRSDYSQESSRIIQRPGYADRDYIDKSFTREKSMQSVLSTDSEATTFSLRQSLRRANSAAMNNLFGNSYSKREGAFVLLAGALIAFNSGFVNGSCVSGFLTPGRTQSVAGFTSAYTKSALALADGEFQLYGYHACLILSYMFGSFLTGIITPRGTPYQIEPTYGPTFMMGGMFLMAASVLAAFEFPPNYVFFLAAAANGVQNGIASIYSANLIRCSLTGSSTDVALVVAQCIRGNTTKLWKGMVLAMIIGSFWLGSFLSFFLTRRFLTYTLFFNAGLFWLIGIGLVYFLVNELDVSIRAAILGTWKWKTALKSLHKSLSQTRYGNDGDLEDGFGGGAPHQSSLFSMFDEIDDDGNGEIDPDELLDALLKANVKISAKGVRVLIESADANGDGMINKEEWREIVRKIEPT